MNKKINQRNSLDNSAIIKQFLPRDAMHPRYEPWACVCLCPSVTSRRSVLSMFGHATRPTLC